MSDPIAAPEKEAEPTAKPAAKAAAKAATAATVVAPVVDVEPPAPPVDASAVQYATDYLKELGIRTCPECGADLRSMAAYPEMLSCPYGHHQEPV